MPSEMMSENGYIFILALITLFCWLILLHLERPKLHIILAFLSAKGLSVITDFVIMLLHLRHHALVTLTSSFHFHLFNAFKHIKIL